MDIRYPAAGAKYVIIINRDVESEDKSLKKFLIFIKEARIDFKSYYHAFKLDYFTFA